MDGEGVRPAEKPKLINRRKFLGLGLGVALTACVPSVVRKVFETAVTPIPTLEPLPSLENKQQSTVEPTKQKIVTPTENNVPEKPKPTEPGPVETVAPTSNPDILSSEKITFLTTHPFNYGTTDKKQIMMTYNEGQFRGNVVALLDTYKKYGIKSTFFFTGFGLKESGDLLPRMIKEGHLIGCHTWDHSELTNLSDKDLQAEFSQWIDKLHEILPDYKPEYFRAPYGSINQRVLQAAAKFGFQHVGWTVESGGMDDKTIDNVFKNFKLYQAYNRATGGAIILGHNVRPFDISQAELIIKEWISMGYNMVTVDQGKSDKDRWIPPKNTPKIEMTDVEPLPSNPGIMFLGDSLISLGSIPTYVASNLEAKNKTAHFVGDIQSSDNKVPYEGHGGFNTARFVEQLTDDNIKTWTELSGKQTTKNFNQHIPDIVVIQLGTNDAANIALFKKNRTSINIDTYTISNYKKIINYLRSKNPHVRIIISKVPLTQHSDVNQFATEINSHYDQMVGEFSTKVSPVVTTPDWTNYLDPNKHLADDYHPNSAGQRIMADRFTEMILQMMYSPN